MKFFALVAILFLGACTSSAPSKSASEPVMSLNVIAEPYVKLNLALGEIDPDWVDAYYGPPDWKTEAAAEKKSLTAIRDEALLLSARVKEVRAGSADPMIELRRAYLEGQLTALITRAEMKLGKKFSFDEEAKLLYGVVPPRLDDSQFQSVLARLEREVPGDGPLAERLERYRVRFQIPPDRVDSVLRAAMQECRARTVREIPLPAEEAFTLEYVKNKPWSGYNWYQGGYRSLIQINTDLPMAISRALDLACHEGYPGHHAYNVLLEKNLVRDRGWVEFSIYPLFSPQSLIAEGTGNYGLEVAFPAEERAEFDRTVLFPLAGLDPGEAARYHRILALEGEISYASNEAARRYLDGTITRESATDWLIRYGLYAPDRARQRMDFIDKYRSYVINYNYGKDLVREHVEVSGGRRWAAFRELISTPRVPATMRRK